MVPVELCDVFSQCDVDLDFGFQRWQKERISLIEKGRNILRGRKSSAFQERLKISWWLGRWRWRLSILGGRAGRVAGTPFWRLEWAYATTKNTELPSYMACISDLLKFPYPKYRYSCASLSIYSYFCLDNPTCIVFRVVLRSTKYLGSCVPEGRLGRI
jgi:hypothetical protein